MICATCNLFLTIKTNNMKKNETLITLDIGIFILVVIGLLMKAAGASTDVPIELVLFPAAIYLIVRLIMEIKI